MPTASTSNRTPSYTSLYKTTYIPKRYNTSTRTQLSNNALYSSKPNSSTYTPDALSRPLPILPGSHSSTSHPLTYNKPRASSLASSYPHKEHSKYSVLHTLYATPSTTTDYAANSDVRSLSTNYANAKKYNLDANESRASLADRPDVTGRYSSLPNNRRFYTRDSVGELLGRNSYSRTIGNDDNNAVIKSSSRDEIGALSESLGHMCQPSNNSNNLEHEAHSSYDSAAHSSNRIYDQYHTGGKVGLKNLGNTCFMNSILQILSNTRSLLEYCLSGQYKSEVNKRSSMNGALMSAYADLVKHLWIDASCVSPNTFKSQIQRFAPRFMGFQQQDAQEFLRYLLEGLHEDVNRITTRQKPYTQNTDEDDRMSESEKAKEYWQRYLRRDNSKIVEIFVGQLRSELKFSCGHHSVTFDPFWDLSVSIPRTAGDVSITDCLMQFMRDEELDPAETPTCAKCKARKSCRKSFSIHKFPSILVLHLKRFSQEMYRRKLNTLVNFPCTLDLSKFTTDRSGSGGAMYSLYGVCNHSGGTHSGHYTSYAKHASDGQWYYYNDSRVSHSGTSDLASSEAYVLFYERISS